MAKKNILNRGPVDGDVASNGCALLSICMHATNYTRRLPLHCRSSAKIRVDCCYSILYTQGANWAALLSKEDSGFWGLSDCYKNPGRLLQDKLAGEACDEATCYVAEHLHAIMQSYHHPHTSVPTPHMIQSTALAAKMGAPLKP